jgi:SnoaL-like protein
LSGRIGDEYNQTMTKTVETWVRNYRAAWESNDPEQIRALFTDGAVYARVPHDPKAWSGVDAIVDGWLSIKDEPGSTTFEWELLGIAGAGPSSRARASMRKSRTTTCGCYASPRTDA